MSAIYHTKIVVDCGWWNKRIQLCKVFIARFLATKSTYLRAITFYVLFHPLFLFPSTKLEHIPGKFFHAKAKFRSL